MKLPKNMLFLGPSFYGGPQISDRNSVLLYQTLWTVMNGCV